LKKRAWFWISLLTALLLVLLALFPTLTSDIERSFKRFTEPTQTMQPSESPTPGETPSGVPSETPTEAPAKGSGSVGGTVGDSEDDDLVVVPVTPDEEKNDESGLDPRFRYCTHAIAAGYGPYYNGVDPEYAWYNDRDGDGAVCER
jgi:micrococcal nuclease